MPVVDIGYQHSFSQSTILRVLRKHKFNNVKSTIKLNLIEEIKQAQYNFAIKYKN